jgi:hypothetical protein
MSLINHLYKHVVRDDFRSQCNDIGLLGERKVSGLLDDLPEKFQYLENINLENRGDVDRVVIGPTGIWVLEVKNHKGEITYDGRQLLKDGFPMEKDPIKQVWAEVGSVRKLLDRLTRYCFQVQPVIVYCSTYSKVRFGFKPVDGVYIIRPEWLNDLLRGTTIQRLTDAQIGAVSQIISGSALALAQ